MDTLCALCSNENVIEEIANLVLDKAVVSCLPPEVSPALLVGVREEFLSLRVLRPQFLEATNMKTNNQPEAQTYYLPWICRIFGHRWWFTNFDEKFDENGYKKRMSQHKQMTHCDRCGQPNPACT